MAKRFIFLLTLLLMLTVSFAYSISTNADEGKVQDHRVIILEMKSTPYDSILNSIGINPLHIPISEISKQGTAQNKLWIVTSEAAQNLKEADIALLSENVRQGENLLFENSTALSSKFQIQSDPHAIVTQEIQYLSHPDVQIKFKKSVSFVPISKNDLEIFARDRLSQKPIFGGSHFGKGYVFDLAMPIDDESGSGYSRFPYLGETLLQKTNLKPILKGNFQVYLDWGYYYANDPVQLAKKLKDEGVNRVYLSAWYDRNRIDYFYKPFIEAAHANGIAVYAWLEYPMVTKEFWDAHPQWREKTGSGLDAKLDWRYLMALENPDCMKEVLKETDALLDGYDWDGTNLAELYYESPDGGVAKKETFTPMSENFRKNFMSAKGFDPLEIFTIENLESRISSEKTQQLLEYRRQVLQQITGEIESHLKQKLEPRGLELVVTQIDSLAEPDMKDLIGVDSAEVLKQQKEFGFALQVEDSFVSWKLGPSRYAKISSLYKPLKLKNSPFILDINIVDRGPTVFPTSKQTGTEFLQLLSTAAVNADQIALYASNTVYPSDFQYASYAIAGNAKATLNGDTWEVQAQKPVFLEVNTQGKNVMMDGKTWSAYNDQGVWVSAGHHTVQVPVKGGLLPTVKILDSTGLQISSLDDSGGSTEFKYESLSPAYILVENKPIDVYVDGHKTVLLKNSSNEYSIAVKLPAGTHEVRLKKSGSIPIIAYGLAFVLLAIVGTIGVRTLIQNGKNGEV